MAFLRENIVNKMITFCFLSHQIYWCVEKVLISEYSFLFLDTILSLFLRCKSFLVESLTCRFMSLWGWVCLWSVRKFICAFLSFFCSYSSCFGIRLHRRSLEMFYSETVCQALLCCPCCFVSSDWCWINIYFITYVTR